MARGPGALVALRVVTRDAGARGDAVREVIGRDVVRRWPALVGALEAWPGAVAQRGGWDWLWVYAPRGEPGDVGAVLSAALGPAMEASLEGRLVVVAVAGAGEVAARAAIRAAEDEIERWHHGQPAAERRWTDVSPRSMA